jgi:hypothetical protein
LATPISHPRAVTSPQSEWNPTENAIEAYARDAHEELPIEGYATMLAVFLGAFATFAGFARLRRRLPKRVSPADIVLLGVATHELSRVLTRARVTIPLRVPFTHYEGSDGAGQVREEPRGHGLRRAVGSLLTCQSCTGPWVAAGLSASLVFFPRVTRLGSSVFAIAAISDFLHQGYAAARSLSPAHPSLEAEVASGSADEGG